MFYCFVCHEGGDVFTFFMKKLGMDYPTAVREVARRVGITIPERGPSGPDPHEGSPGLASTMRGPGRALHSGQCAGPGKKA